MGHQLTASTTKRYEKCIEVSKRIRFDIDRDVIRDRAFDDGLLRMQARADAEYFMSARRRVLPGDHRAAVETTMLEAYRWQYIVSGVQEPRFAGLLSEMLSREQMSRIGHALSSILNKPTAH